MRTVITVYTVHEAGPGERCTDANPPSDPRMEDLVGQIEEINRLGDLAPGFNWRLPGDQITADSLKILYWLFQPSVADRIFYNMSVWDSVEDLKAFVYRTAHLALLCGKERWIDSEFTGPGVALWWIATGELPSIADSADRLRAIRDRGSTEFAFNFASIWPKPEDSLVDSRLNG